MSDGDFGSFEKRVLEGRLDSLERLETRFYQHVDKDEQLDRQISEKLDLIQDSLHKMEVATLDRIAKMESRVAKLETISAIAATVASISLAGLLGIVFKVFSHA